MLITALYANIKYVVSLFSSSMMLKPCMLVVMPGRHNIYSDRIKLIHDNMFQLYNI